MANNIIIVEGKSDQFFIEKMLETLCISAKVDELACNEVECLNGKDNLQSKLESIYRDTKKHQYGKIGIILDADYDGVKSKIEAINACLLKIDEAVKLEEINKPVYSQNLKSNIICYIMNIKDKGELDTVLKLIASRPAIRADCLAVWRDCLIAHNKDIKDKTFDKIWVDFYQRYDICKENESNAHENCKGAISIKKDIWNLDHECLNDLKTFLKLFA